MCWPLPALRAHHAQWWQLESSGSSALRSASLVTHEFLRSSFSWTSDPPLLWQGSGTAPSTAERIPNYIPRTWHNLWSSHVGLSRTDQLVSMFGGTSKFMCHWHNIHRMLQRSMVHIYIYYLNYIIYAWSVPKSRGFGSSLPMSDVSFRRVDGLCWFWWPRSRGLHRHSASQKTSLQDTTTGGCGSVSACRIVWVVSFMFMHMLSRSESSRI